MLGHQAGKRRIVATVEQPLHVRHDGTVVHSPMLQVVSPVDAVSEHVLVDGQHQFQLDLQRRVELFDGLQRLVEMTHRVGPDGRVVGNVQDPRMTKEGIAAALGDQRDGCAPVGWHLCAGRNQHLGHHRVKHQRQQLFFRSHVVVQRHGPHIKLRCEATHRQRIEPFGIGDADCSCGNVGA